MPRYELTISPDYVKDWGLYEAIREIVQNALDQQKINEDNLMGIDYSSTTKKLIISSDKSNLDKSSLLMGTTTKADNKHTIGQFGEGYKLSLLILTRLGFKCEIRNYKSKELWVPKIINSKRYNSKLLVIDVHKYLFKSVPDSDLTFIIHGVTKEDFEMLSEKILHLKNISEFETIDLDGCRILLDESEKQNIYVNGLFICKTSEDMAFGYDLTPNKIKLDRDRSLVNSFDLQWLTSALWSKYNDNSFVMDLINKKCNDVRYLYHHKTNEDFADEFFLDFKARHGHNALPVHNQYQADANKLKYPYMKSVIVSENAYQIINGSSWYKNLLLMSDRTETPYEKLEAFRDRYEDIFCPEMDEDFSLLMEESEHWR